jgi:LysM repeat protein
MFAQSVSKAWSRIRRGLISTVALGAMVFTTLAAAPAEAATCQAKHTVQRGETLYRIGLKYNLTWDRIAEANSLAKPDKIFAGQVLCIPEAKQPGTPAPAVIPMISVNAVVKDQTVTIQTKDFPANQKFTVRMGKIGTQGINGTVVTTTDSGKGGSLTMTYTIPAELKGLQQISIRLESASGYYSYNWFYNNSTK